MASERARNLVLISTIVGASIVYIDSTSVNLALPAMQREFGAELDFLQWIVDSYLLFVAAPMLAAGALCDRYGAVKIYIWGSVVFAVASVLCGIADSGSMLVAARMLQGLGGGLLSPAALALIAASFPPERLGRGIGIFVTASALTSVIGPLLGGWLIDNLSWRWIFFINPAITAISFALLFAAGRLDVARRDTPLDITCAILVTIGLGLIVWGLISIAKPGMPVAAIAATLIGVVALVIFWINESRLGDRAMMPTVFFRNQTFLGITLVTLVFYAGLFVYLFYAPFFLIQVWDFDAFTAGAASLPFVLMISGWSTVAGRITDRFGARAPLLIGLTIATLGFSGFLLLDENVAYLMYMLPTYIIAGTGMGLMISPLTKVAMNSLPIQITGMASAINHTVSRVGGMIGIPIAGLIVGHLFSSALTKNLTPLQLENRIREELLSQSHSLMAIDIPQTVPASLQTEIGQAIERAFITSFHGAMWVVVVCGLVSVTLAWAMVERRKQPSSRRPIAKFIRENVPHGRFR
jgi:EmrB/QacA subfamily drug resistance transporter